MKHKIVNLYPFLPLNKQKAFDSQMEYYKITPCWQKLTEQEQEGVVLKLLNQLDMSKRSLRQKAARCILYLAQVS